jgi:hypothetical protein
MPNMPMDAMTGDPEVRLVACDPAAKDEWSSLLDAFNDASLYQSWEYADVHWAYCRRERFVVRKGGEAVSLAQVIILDLPMIRIAYVPWGPVWRKRGVPDDPSSFGLAVGLLKDEYVRRRKMVLRIRPYGFAERDPALKTILEGEGFSSAKVDPGGAPRTILVDLACSEEELRRRLSKKWRNSLTFSEKEPLTIKESRDGNSLVLLEPLYAALKKKKGFSGTDLAELAAVQERLSPAHKLRISLCEHEGQVVAGSICSGLGATALGLLGVTSDEGRKSRAYYLLQWDEILWAMKTAHVAYDLNGINPEKNPSVYHFKAGLKGREVTFLGVYDRYPRKLSRWIVFLSDRAVRRFKKGRIRGALKRFRRPGR